jgi:hypothetical protein
VSLSVAPAVRTVYRADLTCYLCAAVAATVEWEQQPGRPTVRGEDEPRRCPRCGGGLYPAEVVTLRRRDEVVNWHEDAPRRGRPPKNA